MSIGLWAAILVGGLPGCGKSGSTPAATPATDDAAVVAATPAATRPDVGWNDAAKDAAPPDHDSSSRDPGLADPDRPPALGKVIAKTPAGFTKADLAAFAKNDDDESVVVFYSLASGKPAEVGRLAVPEALSLGGIDGEWANRDTLALWFSGSDKPVVVRVSAADAVVLPLPDQAFFATDKPKNESGDERNEIVKGTGETTMEATMVVTSGEVWWAECAWGYRYDGFDCLVWVHARLWPKPGRKVDAELLPARRWALPKRAAPKGFVVDGEYLDPKLTCTANGKKVVLTSLEGEDVMASHWVSTEPPQLLVVWGEMGLNQHTPSRWTLHAGCAADPIATGTEAAAGPGDLWLAEEVEGTPEDFYDAPTRAVIRRGAKVLGQLAEGTSAVRFRPPQ